MKLERAVALSIGDAVANKFGTKGEVVFVFSSGLVQVAFPKGVVLCMAPADLTEECCNGASRDCVVHGDGN